MLFNVLGFSHVKCSQTPTKGEGKSRRVQAWISVVEPIIPYFKLN